MSLSLIALKQCVRLSCISLSAFMLYNEYLPSCWPCTPVILLWHKNEWSTPILRHGNFELKSTWLIEVWQAPLSWGHEGKWSWMCCVCVYVQIWVISFKIQFALKNSSQGSWSSLLWISPATPKFPSLLYRYITSSNYVFLFYQDK